MLRNRLWSALLGCVLLVGCASPSWVVLRQEAAQEPLGQRISIEPLDTSHLATVQGLNEPTSTAKASADFVGFASEAAKTIGGLAVEQQAPDLIVRSKVAEADAGFASTIYTRPSKLVIHVSLERPDGRVLEVIQLQSSTNVSTDTKTSAARLERDLKVVTQRLGSYLAARTKGPEQAR
jgi:hypothetical protein